MYIFCFYDRNTIYIFKGKQVTLFVYCIHFIMIGENFLNNVKEIYFT